MTTDRSEQSGPEVDNPWRESIENCIEGSNYLRASEYKKLLLDLDHGYQAAAALLTERASHQQAVEALTKRAESAEARLARVAAVLADLRGRLTPSADFLADQIAAAIAPQDDTPPAARRGED